MKLAIFGLLCVIALCFTTTQPACMSATQIKQNGLACAGKEVSAALVEQVALDLFTKNFAALEALAASDGLDFVNCIVTTAVAAATTPPATGSAAQAVAPSPTVVNGNEWLSTHPVSK